MIILKPYRYRYKVILSSWMGKYQKVKPSKAGYITMAPASSSRPTVLHLGDAIKYNHDFYDNEFAARFNVLQATETDRSSFIEALKSKKLVSLPLLHYLIYNGKC